MERQAVENLLAAFRETAPFVQVPSNGTHRRYYSEPQAEYQWDKKHHLIDLEDQGGVSFTLTLTQVSSEGMAQVQLNDNEISELLTILLQWQLSHMSEEEPTQDATETLDDLDDHPF